MTIKIYLAGFLVLVSFISALCVEDLHLLTSVPSVLVDGEAKLLRVRCYFQGTSTVSIPSITLDFRKTSSAQRQLARVSGTSATITDPSLASRATVDGSITTPTTASYLHLDIHNVSCADVGFYTCKTQYSDANGTHPLETDGEVAGESRPTELEVRHDPIKPKYPVGDEVTIICSGKVGKPARNWTWQKYNEERELWFPYNLSWTQTPPVVVSDCAFYGSTSLKYRIEDATEHKFRCVVGLNVDDSVQTSVNGDVSGASCQQILPALLLCPLLYSIWLGEA